FHDPIIFLAGLQSSWEYGQHRLAIFVGGKEMSFRNFIYTEEDEDLTFLPKDLSPGFNIGSPSVSINTEPVRTDEEPTVEHATEPATKPANKRVGTIADSRGKGFLDNHLDVDLLDLHDYCYVMQAIMDNAVNRRSRELLEVIEKLREKMSSLATEAKEHKGNLDRLMLESQKWLGYQEIEEVKHDKREVVSKVVPYACMELLHSDELCSLVGKLVSSVLPSAGAGPINRLEE
ncbi:hypothetical protein Tco_1558223, partial [Tanacetum coccineum]